MPDSLQFFVTRLGTNLYRIVVQNETGTIREAEVAVSAIMDKIGYELEQLKSRE